MRGILFDNDGTLVDSEALILDSMRHATRAVLGETIPDEVLMAKVGIPLAEQMRDFTPDPALQQELLRVYRAYNHEMHDTALTLFEGEEDALGRLARAGHPMGVVTSKMHWLAQRGLEVLGIWDRFEVLVGCDDCDRAKPDPAPVAMGARLLGLEPRDCIYVGDSRFDIAAGRAAGCKTVAVTWGMAPEEQLAAEGPDRICRMFDELPAIVSELLGD